MKRLQGLSGAALILLIGLTAVGCAPKEETTAVAPPGATTRSSADSTAAAKIETATLKAVGMT